MITRIPSLRLLSVIVVMATVSALAEPRLIGALRTSGPLTLDGKLEEACWHTADIAGDFILFEKKDPASRKARASVCYDAERLHVGGTVLDSPADAARADVADRDGPVWDDDSFEVFLDVKNDHNSFHQFIVNSLGTVFDGRSDSDGGFDAAWNGNVKVAAHREADRWSFEMSVPLSDIGLSPEHGQVAGINFCRNDSVSNEWSSWAPTRGSFRKPELFGHVVFGLSVKGMEKQIIDRYVAPPAPVSVAGKRVASLVKNGSFEQTVPGIDPRFPDHWIEERWSVNDYVRVVTDPREAHMGRRCLRMYAPQERGIRLHGRWKLTPGGSYTIRAWARCETEAEAELTILPGPRVFPLSPEWREFSVDYTHPADAPGEMGIIIEVKGGPALVDDVSVVGEGGVFDVPAELAADRIGLTVLPAQGGWRALPDEPVWQERIPLRIAEVMGEPAQAVPVSFQIRHLFPGFTYNYLFAEKLRVVDSSTAKDVSFAILEADNFPGLSPRDVLSFPVSCPARTEKTYHAYLANRRKAPMVAQPRKERPDFLEGPVGYKWALDADRLPVEHRVSVGCRVAGSGAAVALRCATATSADAVLVSPTGKQRISVPLRPQAGQRGIWLSGAGFAMPASAPKGVWKLEATFKSAAGKTEVAESSFVYGSALWPGSPLRRILKEDEPDYRAHRAQVSGARNEAVAFQVALDTSVPLGDVRLSSKDLIHEDAKTVIPAGSLRIDRIEEIYLSCPTVGPDGYIGAFGYVPYSGRAGYYPDMLLPWRPVDLKGQQRRLAWVTINIPESVSPGRYLGEITASAAGGAVLRLPVELHVYDFALPDAKSFTLVLGADLQTPMGRSADRWYGGDTTRYAVNFGRQPFYVDEEAVLSLARFFLRRGVTPFYYYQDGSFYPTPWRYQPGSGTAVFDFAIFDRNAKRLDGLRPRHFFFGSEWRTGWGHAGYIRDGSTYGMKSEHSAYNDQPLSSALHRAWCAGIRAHLKERGLDSAACMYITDEPHGNVEAVTAQKAAVLKEAFPELLTFAAGSGIGKWRDYFEYTDIFSGAMDPGNRKRYADAGGTSWGPYNRPMFIAMPLAIARVVGLDSWVRGYPAYFHYAVASHRQDSRVNPKRLSYDQLGRSASDPTPRSATAGGVYPRLTYLDGYLMAEGFDALVYPWPEDEPMPSGTTRAFASSMRFEALVQSVNDYEYMRILADLASQSPEGSKTRSRFNALRGEVESLLRDSCLGGGTEHNVVELQVYQVDPARFARLRDGIAKAIEEAGRPGKG